MKSYLHNITIGLIFTFIILSNYSYSQYSQYMSTNSWTYAFDYDGAYHGGISTVGCNTITVEVTSDDNSGSAYIDSWIGTTWMNCDASTYTPNVMDNVSLAVAFAPGFGGIARTGTMVITFAQPIDNPILHIERIGGVDAGIANTVVFDIVATSGLTLTPLSSISSNFQVTSTQIKGPHDIPLVNTYCGVNSDDATGGSVMINGTNISSVTFNWSGLGPNPDDEIEIAISIPPTNASSNLTINQPCLGEDLIFSDNDPNNVSWQWEGPNGFTSTTQTNTIPNSSMLNAGTYNVTTTDNNGCLGFGTIDANFNSSPIANAGNDIFSCDASVTITASDDNNGTNTYVWNNGLGAGASHTVSPTSGTEYIVTVTNSNGCSDIDTVMVSLGSMNFDTTLTNVSCYGLNDGEIDLTLNGTAPYTINWSNGATTELLSNLTAGNYTITASDNVGCELINTFTITQPIEIQIQSNTTNIDCFGNNTGAIDLTVTGGTPGYTFAWDNSQTTEDIANLSANTYNVMVEDANNCSATHSVTITEPTQLATSVITTNICFGATNGDINLTVSGGTSPYTFVWDNTTQTTEDITNLSANTYTATITDNNNCSITQSATITQSPEITSSIVATDISCFGLNNGDIDLSVNGGIAPYTFVWDNTSQTTEDINNLSANTYNVTIYDANNCTSINSTIVSEPSQLSASSIQTNVLCFGENNGQIDLTVSGGTPPYSYNWSNSQHTEDINNLPQNTYFVTVEDANGCTVTNSGVITEPLEITVSENSNSILCHGDETGIIDISVSEGTVPYTYNWSNQAITEDLTNISAGTYTVTITDNSGCTKIQSITLSEPNELVASLPSNYTHCNHDTEILASVEGGTTPYSFLWNNGSVSQNIQYQTNNTATYTVTVTDNNGCTTSDEITISIVSVSLDVFANEDTVCPGEPVLVSTNITGGMPPYTIYDNGSVATFPITIYPNGQENYTLQVIDACGNTANAVLDIYIHLVQPLNFTADKLHGCPPLTVNFNQNDYSYNYNYIWNFDDVNENNLSLSTNPTHTFTQSGFYDISVQLIDSNGCKNQLTIENMIEVYQKPDAQFYVENDVTSFINSTIDFDNYSSDNYYNYWFFGDGDSSLMVNPSHNYNGIGIYYPILVVENEYGCRDTAIHTIEVKDEFTLYIPTAFSPDNDGINDGFRAVGHGIDTDRFTLRVYDRWGEIIWQSNDLFEEWKGMAKDRKLVQNGTYRWLVVCEDFNGVEHTKSGNVTVIR